MDPLVRNQLRAARKNRVSACELENRRCQSVRLHFRVAVERSHHALRFLLECVTRSVNQITANVVNAATAALHLVANVPGVRVEVAKDARHRPQISNAPFVKQRAQPSRLQSAANHESFANLDAGPIPHSDQRLGLRNRQADRLFAQHVFARFGCEIRPLACMRRFPGNQRSCWSACSPSRNPSRQRLESRQAFVLLRSRPVRLGARTVHFSQMEEGTGGR